MARSKEFGRGIAALFGENEEDNSLAADREKAPSQEALEEVEPEKRATFIVRSDHIERLKAIAFWERKKIKEVLSDALEGYFKGLDKDGKDSYVKNAMDSYRSLKGK